MKTIRVSGLCKNYLEKVHPQFEVPGLVRTVSAEEYLRTANHIKIDSILPKKLPSIVKTSLISLMRLLNIKPKGICYTRYPKFKDDLMDHIKFIYNKDHSLDLSGDNILKKSGKFIAIGNFGHFCESNLSQFYSRKGDEVSMRLSPEVKLVGRSDYTSGRFIFEFKAPINPAMEKYNLGLAYCQTNLLLYLANACFDADRTIDHIRTSQRLSTYCIRIDIFRWYEDKIDVFESAPDPKLAERIYQYAQTTYLTRRED